MRFCWYSINETSEDPVIINDNDDKQNIKKIKLLKAYFSPQIYNLYDIQRHLVVLCSFYIDYLFTLCKLPCLGWLLVAKRSHNKNNNNKNIFLKYKKACIQFIIFSLHVMTLYVAKASEPADISTNTWISSHAYFNVFTSHILTLLLRYQSTVNSQRHLMIQCTLHPQTSSLLITINSTINSNFTIQIQQNNTTQTFSCTFIHIHIFIHICVIISTYYY